MPPDRRCGILGAVTDDRGWLTSAEAAAILDRSPQQVRWLARHGHIEGEPVDGRWRFTATSVHAEAEERARWVSYEDAAALTGTDHHAVWRAAQAGEIDRRQAHRANPALLRTSVEAWGARRAERRAAEAAAAEARRAAREAAAGPPDEEHVWLRSPVVAIMLGITTAGVDVAARRGAIPHTMVGRRRWFRRDHVEQLAAARALLRRAAAEGG